MFGLLRALINVVLDWCLRVFVPRSPLPRPSPASQTKDDAPSSRSATDIAQPGREQTRSDEVIAPIPDEPIAAGPQVEPVLSGALEPGIHASPSGQTSSLALPSMSEFSAAEHAPDVAESPHAGVIADGKSTRRPNPKAIPPRRDPQHAQQHTRSGERIRNRAPELVCRRQGDRWCVGLETDDGFDACDDAQALDRRLPAPWLFALSADEETGRRISRCTAGFRLLVAPEGASWVRRPDGYVTVNEHAPIAPGFRAWHIRIRDDSTGTIHVEMPDGSARSILASKLRFVLSREPEGWAPQATPSGVERGSLIPVYFAEPPSAALSDEEGRFDQLVIVKEGSREENTTLDDVAGFAGMIRTRGPGWYGVRLYAKGIDGHPVLEDSQSFWYAPMLRALEVSASGMLPDVARGEHARHDDVTITLRHTTDVAVSSAAVLDLVSDIRYELPVEYGTTAATVRVTGERPCDAIDIDISRGLPLLRLRAPVRQYWWAIADERAAPSEWCARTLTVRRADAKATSRLALWLRPPQPRDEAPRLLRSDQDAAMAPDPCGSQYFRCALRDLNVTNATTGPLELRLRVEGEEPALVLRVVPAFRCRQCESFESEQEATMVAHVRTHISSVLRREDNYEALREAYLREHPEAERLPAVIHRCDACGQCYDAEMWRGRSGGMLDHFRECPAIGPEDTDPPFSIVKNLNEIEASVFRDIARQLGEGYRCEICRAVVFGSANAERHVFEAHKRDLYDSN
jgi:hypothetical protein